MMQPGRYIGIDIGGTKTAIGLVHFPSGKLEAVTRIPTLPERGGAPLLADIESAVAEQAAGEEVNGVGLGICELVSPEGEILTNGCIKFSARELRDRLARFGPVTIEADVRAAALAEADFGAGLGKRVFLYVTIGTGISSCLVVEGRPFAGALGAAGTLASGRMPVGGRPLEEFASGPGLAAAHGAAASAPEVLKAAENGEGRAIEAVRRGGSAVGAAIGWLINVLDPAVVVLGGGLGLQPGLYRDELVAAARAHAWWPGHREVPIVSALTGIAAGVIGAAAAAARERT